MTTTSNNQAMRLLGSLPGIYQQDPFLANFLYPFEEIFFGAAPTSKGLETTISNLASYFVPQQTPEEFLPWLGKWVALGIKEELEIPKQREVLARLIPMYGLRGTKKNLEELITLFTDYPATVEERVVPEFQIGVHSTIEVDTYIEGSLSYQFHVVVQLTKQRKAITQDPEHLIRVVIEAEKPAHTDYSLEIRNLDEEGTEPTSFPTDYSQDAPPRKEKGKKEKKKYKGIA